MPRVSVVTPFYNTARYLAECVESVLAQDFDDFEYVLVDNHSDDGSGAIAAGYAAEDPRIRILQPPEFLSQVDNYNFALANIDPSSAYVKMVQADDAVLPRCLTEMVALADANATVGLVSAYELIEETVSGCYLTRDRPVLAGRDAARLYLLQDVFLFGSPTTVMYRADLVRARTPFFDPGRLHEDTEVVFELLHQADFGFVHQVLTYTRRQEGALSDSIKDQLTQKIDQLVNVTRYGPWFLDEQELAETVRHKRCAYYRALARRQIRTLARRDERFWAYQERGLATIGETIDRRFMRRQIVPALLERIGGRL